MRMRPSADQRAPGIYQTFDQVVIPAMSIANTRIAGFVGITQKGPMNEPTRLGNWDEFLEIFGYTQDSYTSDSVYGFFKNGGTDCWVVRVAHNPAKGELASIDQAASAEHVQLDDWNKPTLKIRALNEGNWGNAIWVRCAHAPAAQALLTRDLRIKSSNRTTCAASGAE